MHLCRPSLLVLKARVQKQAGKVNRGIFVTLGPYQTRLNNVNITARAARLTLKISIEDTFIDLRLQKLRHLSSTAVSACCDHFGKYVRIRLIGVVICIGHHCDLFSFCLRALKRVSCKAVHFSFVTWSRMR